MRNFWSVALAGALLAAQWAGQLHAFEHVRHDLALAKYIAASVADADATVEKKDGRKPPALDHGRDHCIVFQGLDCAPARLSLAVVAAVPAAHHPAGRMRSIRPAARPPYAPRAPPIFS